MKKHGFGFWLEVSGDYACFTRPELKSERISYEVPTPSAARAVFDAILWKPAIFWQIDKIVVLNKIDWFSIRRNEVGSIARLGSEPIYIEDARQQRASLVLRNVRYYFHATFDFIKPEDRRPVKRPVPEYLMQTDFEEYAEWQKERDEIRPDEKPEKYAAMFDRRARKSQHYSKPYLGCREFSADVRLIDNPRLEDALQQDGNFGWMLYDMDYSRALENIYRPLFYEAKMEKGVINVPPRSDREKVKG